MKLTGKKLIPISSRKCNCGDCKKHSQQYVEEELPAEIVRENTILRNYAKRVTGSPFIRIEGV